MNIRHEMLEDVDAIRRVNELAFGRPNEARLVDALREAASPFLSLVADVDGEIVGHICFSPVEVEREDGFRAFILGLAPMAVLPEHQNQGIGSELVVRGLEECRNAGFGVVVVLGHPEYYPRFGFEPASWRGVRSEYDVPDPVFMITELKRGAAVEIRGLARYHEVFKDAE
ncbi:MAG TPA: N-acetyltransferase [Thermoanaerobaculia bacterium]|jgi:putative acetyltransferase|nr:N-acetyltransferase [Thermoanaerobaculia bacterium]